MTTTFDPIAFKTTTRAQWQEAAAGVARVGSRDRGLARRRHRADARRRPPDQRREGARRRRRRRRADARRPPAGSDRPGTCWRPTSPPRSWSSRPARPHGRPLATSTTLEADGEDLSAVPDGELRRRDLPRRPHLLPGPAPRPDRDLPHPASRRPGQPRSCTPRPTATASSPSRSGSSGGSPACPRPLRGCRGRSASERRVSPRRAYAAAGLVDVERHGRPVAGPDGQRRGLRAVRAGVVRRAAPDAERPRPRPARRGLARGRGGAHPVRDAGRVRRPVRDARRRPAPDLTSRPGRVRGRTRRSAPGRAAPACAGCDPTWVLTVDSLANTAPAISAFDRPRATASNTSRSLSVSPRNAAGGVAVGLELPAPARWRGRCGASTALPPCTVRIASRSMQRRGVLEQEAARAVADRGGGPVVEVERRQHDHAHRLGPPGDALRERRSAGSPRRRPSPASGCPSGRRPARSSSTSRTASRPSPADADDAPSPPGRR